ncbi:MAG: PAS domain-containing protein, partial [Tepidisphaeraceae bacterium]
MADTGQSRSELLKTIHLLRSALDGNGDTVFVKDRQGKYLYMNEAGARRFNRPLSEIIGNDSSSLFDAESA